MIKPVLISLLASAGFIAAADLPTAEAVFDKYIEATGGKAGYEKLNAVSMHGTMELAGQAIKGDITIITARPDKLDIVLDLSGIGKFRSAAGGGNAWDVSPIQGPRILDGEERDLRLRNAHIDAYVQWRETYGDVKVDGEDTIDGKDCWRLLAKPPKASKPETLWFDKQTGLVVKTTTTIFTAGSEVTAQSLPSDYRDVNGMKFPFKLRQIVGPQTIEMTFDQVKLNPDLPPGQFEPPPDVQALLTKK